jgi:glyoxylase I family protein
MLFNKIHHVAIICSDYPQSRNFYVEKLGLEVVQETYRKQRDSYKLDLAVGGQYQIELFYFPGRPARPSFPEARGLRHLAFEVDNVEDTVAELNRQGITTEPIRIDEITGRKFTFFADPDDLPLEIYER